MAIRAASLLPVRLELRAPLVTAHGPIASRDAWIVELVDDAGRCGYGEASPIAGFPGESFEQAGGALRTALPALLERAAGERRRAKPSAAPGGAPIASGALQTALLDLSAQQVGVPLWQHLLVRLRERSEDVPEATFDGLSSVAVNALLTAAAPDALAEQAGRAADAGFTTLKLKLHADDLDLDCMRLEAVANSVGEHVRVRADANGGWSEERALEACAALDDHGLQWIEQPVAADAGEALHRVARASAVPIAADESASRLADAEAVIATGACAALVLKPALLGGPEEAIRLAHRALRSGMLVAVTTLIDSAIGRSMASHVAMAVRVLEFARGRTPEMAHGLATGVLLADDLTRARPAPTLEPGTAGDPEVEGGRRRLPPAPGLGVAPHLDALERLRSAPTTRWGGS